MNMVAEMIGSSDKKWKTFSIPEYVMSGAVQRIPNPPKSYMRKQFE